MKRNIKLLIATAVSVLISVSLCIGISAETEKSFNDVSADAWYYDAVSITVQKGIFTGTSAVTFEPNAPMTRAMFVKTLAMLTGADVSEYTEVSFDDVVEGAWYANYVEWAYREEITKGVGNGLFGVDDHITREQMITLFYNTAAKSGEDIAVADTFKYDKTADSAQISSWATDAMKWALSSSIISGNDTVGTSIIVSPDKSATRAEAAQIITRYLDFLDRDLPYVTDLTIDGNPIKDYKIVYGANSSYPQLVKDASNKLQTYIQKATGFTLPIVTDETEYSGLEFIIGKTNRETRGVVTADRDGEDVSSFEISVQRGNVLIAGKNDRSGHYGTVFGVYAFARKVLGYEFYSDGVTVNNVIRGFNLENGYEFKDGPGYEYRVVYWPGLVSEELSTGEPFHHTGMVHNMCELVEIGAPNSPDPCLTDPVNIETIKKNFMNRVWAKADIEAIWVSQNDTSECCMCDNCLDVYREEGSRSGTLMRLLNELADLLEENGYPYVDIWTLAYVYTTSPVNSKLDENIVVYYCPINNCSSHTYNDPSCLLNRSVVSQLTGWSKVCSKIYIWDYSTNFKYSQTPMPIHTVFLENRRWMYQFGVRGEFNNAMGKDVGEFAALKAFLLAETQFDPNMTDEEYESKIDGFLEAYYGPGWKAVREYLDTIELLSDANCFSYHCVPSSVISHEVSRQYADKFNALWDKAEALCENQEQYDRIRITRLSWIYMYLDTMHEVLYVNGDSAQKNQYETMATEYYNELKYYNLAWSGMSSSGIAFDTTKSPVEW